MIYWTGVGSRKTPPSILKRMSRLASQIELELGYTLRTGGAIGADEAFAKGVKELKEIYIPWKGYNGHRDIFIESSEAIDIAAAHHPNSDNLSDTVKALMTRNVFQVLGGDISTPSGFLICYTPDGCVSTATRTRNTGGTGLAISIADTYNIPVVNMFNSGWEKDLEDIINSM